MRKELLSVGVLLAFVALCGGGLWWLFGPPGRHIGSFDIGQGREVRIWSEGDWLEPVGMYYQISEGGEVVWPKSHIGVDRGQRFEFRTASAAGGKLSCVYEVNSATNRPPFLIIYDSETHESWPRLKDGDWSGDPAVMRKWQDRYRKLRDDNPEMPKFRGFED